MTMDISKFVHDQLSVWPLAAGNFRRLKDAETKEMTVGELRVRLQHNPARIVSSAARLDKETLAHRPCFLCQDNRPPEQLHLRFDGRKERVYHILVNPYPIFQSHLVVAMDQHVPQSIWHHYSDMEKLASSFPGYSFFYNGPHCGASAPDHFHFQGCPRHLMPLENEADRLLDIIASQQSDGGVPNGSETPVVPEHIRDDIEYVSSVQEAQVYHYKHFTRGVFFLRSRTSKSMAKMFYRLLDCAPIPEGDSEPLFNAMTWYQPLTFAAMRPEGSTHGLAPFEYRAVVVFRSRHRSHHYFSEGDDHLTMSPGCADMMGMFIVPSASDYEKITPALLGEMVEEVSVSEKGEESILWRLTRTQPHISVGIMSGEEICFEVISDGAGPQKVAYKEGKISYNGALYDELYFEAQTPSTLFAVPTFILHDVTIGKQFHWERQRTQRFAGSLKFIVSDNKVVAINVIGMEDYLLSVISSEMRSSAGLELLKAHAVISRSWVMARLEQEELPRPLPPFAGSICGEPALVTALDGMLNADKALGASSDGDEPEMIGWQDGSMHRDFDVCADDHCQRYQGLTDEIAPDVQRAIDETWGEILTYGGGICDARFSKCCGGASEKFASCWQDEDKPYLQSLPDTPGHAASAHPFCDTSDAAVLAEVLNDYDLEDKEFYQWRVEYGRKELADLISSRLGEDIGELLGLVPLQRGPSGRIVRLRVVGSKRTFVIGKELTIRRYLSPTHLKSSAFEVSFLDGKVVLAGRGWGHGVGLCQIGAAVMAHEGYGYKDILSHYYPGSSLERR